MYKSSSLVFFLSLLSVSSVFVTSCAGTRSIAGDPLEAILASENPNIKRVMDAVGQYEVQIRYTQIDREKDSVILMDYDFQVDADRYFYPASTVKFPAAVLALEKLNQMNSLDRDTRFYVEGDSVETTFAEAISQIFAVSDNNAYNRLVEFLGQDAINEGLREKGIGPVRIAHRLGYHSDDLATKPLVIYQNDSTTTMLQGRVDTAPEPLDLQEIQKGIGYYEEDSLIKEPFDFSLKNYYPIDAQHQLLKRVIFPQNFLAKERFDLGDDRRQFLMTALHTVPRKVGYDSSGILRRLLQVFYVRGHQGKHPREYQNLQQSRFRLRHPDGLRLYHGQPKMEWNLW